MNSCNKDKPVLRLPLKQLSDTRNYVDDDIKGYQMKPMTMEEYKKEFDKYQQIIASKLYMDDDKLVMSLLSAEDIYKKE